MDAQARESLVFVCEIIEGQIKKTLELENWVVALLQAIEQKAPEVRREWNSRMETIALAPTRDASVKAEDELRQIQRIIQRLKALPQT